ncbi:hypothetical protein ABK040_006185 [Willaertia magna]
MHIQRVETTPIEGQKMGTSGLRKKVKVVASTPHFLENFIQSVFNFILNKENQIITENKDNENNTFYQLVIGGDGRYYNKQAIQTILEVLYANCVNLKIKVHVLIGQNGLVSTPAVSCMIRKYKAELGGLILTASHNPGGEQNDWGIKYNTPNGGPAPEKVTDKIFEISQNIKEYFICKDLPNIDLSQVNDKAFGSDYLKVSIIDAVNDYFELLNTIFDMNAIKELLSNHDFNFLFDAMHGVTGLYAKRILHDQLGAKTENLLNCDPKEDFGGGHPDPNLTYAEELVKRVLKDEESKFDFGAASDGDGDRNMVLGKHFFVNPSDSVAIIADYAQKCIPYFKKNSIKGLARSMPTSTAIDRVAKELGVEIYETPTGWKYFGNLFDAGKLSICGEESFGTGSDHIREKDGMWAVLSWLSILAYEKSINKNVSVKDIVVNHWKKYGRSYYSRYDYEEVSADGANSMMNYIRDNYVSNDNTTINENSLLKELNIVKCEEFSYLDPIDQSFTGKQGFIFKLSDGSRIIFRLSGTGSAGATIRVYFEKYNATFIEGDPLEEVKTLAEIALRVSKLQEFTGRNSPTVIT